MKTEILDQLLQENPTTVALGMGVDIGHIHLVIHLMVPWTVEDYYQEIGRAGSDCKPAVAKNVFQWLGHCI